MITVRKQGKEISGEASDTEMNYRGVFHSLDAVLAPLKSEQYGGLPEVLELLDIYKKSLAKFKTDDNVKRQLFIVLEGLDGAGKSTITKKLANKMGARKMNTPPASISHLRPCFDKHDPTLRRAYYALGNYIAATEVKFLSTRAPVIMDRFWNSTAVYALGNEVKAGKPMPPPDSVLYQWPTDLLQPDFIFYLSVSEHIRLSRLSNRTEYTKEENDLMENKLYRENMEELYKRMKPRLRFVNCDGSPAKVRDNIEMLIKEAEK